MVLLIYMQDINWSNNKTGNKGFSIFQKASVLNGENLAVNIP
jgi:hypothetical protein